MHASPGARRSDWLVPSMLIALALVPSLAGSARLMGLARGGPVTAENARFFAMPIPVVLHILAAVPFAILGAFQFSPGLRRRSPRWHKASGRILIPLAMVVALTGLWMTVTYPWPAADGMAVYLMRLVVGVAMAGAVGTSVWAIAQRDFRRHGAWMIRAYAIGMGAGTQVFTHLPWFIFMSGPPTEGSRAVMMGAGWVINVMVAERVIRGRSLRSTKHAITYPSTSRTS